jgi:eukaryotic-like serine/threonine-protein kinase
VAKILASPDGAQSVKTRTGSLMGTPLYMSPEQCKGAGALDHRTDIYSLGVMLFEMLAGRPPFIAEGVGELFAKHMLEEPPALLDFVPQTPPHMAAAIMKALAKEPRDRFQTMDEFRQALIGEIKVAAPTRSGRPTTASLNAQTLSPRASTTLSSATSEIDGPLSQPGRRKRIYAIAGGVAAAVIIGLLVLPKGQPKVEAPPVALPAPVVAPPVPVAPPLKKTVTIRFEADPPGAHLIRKKDDHDLGQVPVEVQLPRGGSISQYLFRLDGYREIALAADPTADRTLHVSLDKVAAPAVPVAADASKKHAAHHAGAKRPKNPVDEDGLATPSF